MSKPIPEFDTDLFSKASVRDARAVDDRLREFAPVVRLPGEQVTMLARYEHVAVGLKDWKTFSSTSRPWHDPKSVRPELLLTDDPPKHTRVRTVISNALSPRAPTRCSRACARAAAGRSMRSPTSPSPSSTKCCPTCSGFPRRGVSTSRPSATPCGRRWAR
jgi:cytochrome P450